MIEEYKVAHGIEPSFGLLLKKSLADVFGQFLQEVFEGLDLAIGGDMMEDVPTADEGVN